MRARRLVAFFVAFWVTPTVSHAGYITDPDPDEILIHVGEPTLDMSSGFVDFQLSLHFGDNWLGQSLSFVGINVERSRINGISLATDSVHFSRFSFVPTPDSAIEAWGVSPQRFGDATTPGLEEWIATPGIHSLPKVTAKMSIGTLRFDFGSTEPSGPIGLIGTLGPTSIDSLFVDLGAGMSSSNGSNGTNTVIGLLGTNDPNATFQFIDPKPSSDSRITYFEAVGGSQVVPEPSVGVRVAFAIASALAVCRRRSMIPGR